MKGTPIVSYLLTIGGAFNFWWILEPYSIKLDSGIRNIVS